MNYLFSIQIDTFREQFNDATRQVVKLQMSAINLQAKVNSLQAWEFKGFSQLDDQKSLVAQVKRLESTVDQINKTIDDLGVTDADDSESLMIDNLNEQSEQINSTLKKISRSLESTKKSLLAKSVWAVIADFIDGLGQVLEEIFIQSITYARKAINLLPEKQREDVKKFFGYFQNMLPKGKD